MGGHSWIEQLIFSKAEYVEKWSNDYAATFFVFRAPAQKCYGPS